MSSIIVAATSDQVTVRPDEDLAFWDLVCADDDWLRTEFDAIVAREYPDRRAPHPRPAPRWPEPVSRGSRPEPWARRPHGGDAPLRRAPRQRSPPPRQCPDPRPEEVMTSDPDNERDDGTTEVTA